MSPEIIHLSVYTTKKDIAIIFLVDSREEAYYQYAYRDNKYRETNKWRAK
jgi:hypothetical protein